MDRFDRMAPIASSVVNPLYKIKKTATDMADRCRPAIQ